jgi:hypothetical protein
VPRPNPLEDRGLKQVRYITGNNLRSLQKAQNNGFARRSVRECLGVPTQSTSGIAGKAGRCADGYTSDSTTTSSLRRRLRGRDCLSAGGLRLDRVRCATSTTHGCRLPGEHRHRAPTGRRIHQRLQPRRDSTRCGGCRAQCGRHNCMPENRGLPV